MSGLSAEALAEGLIRAGVPREKALARARAELGIPDVRTTEQLEADDARDEKRIVAAADKQLRALGFVAVNFSQPRESKQTPGIPDREYFHPGRGIFLKWEAKTATGRQSPAQCQYQEWCRACGVPYVLGTDQDLFEWLISQGIAARTVGDLLISLPAEPSRRSA